MPYNTEDTQVFSWKEQTVHFPAKYMNVLNLPQLLWS